MPTSPPAPEPIVTPFVPPKRRDEPPLPLPTDDEVPQETIDVLAGGRDALLRLVGAVFRAAGEIVAALLRLVQTVAGRDAAEAVDRRAAGALDPLVPDARPGQERAAPPPAAPPTGGGAADPGLRDDVRGVLLAHAGTDAERDAVSPAFVDAVTAGVRFALSVERQFPGAVAALVAQEAPAHDAETGGAAGGGAAPEAEAAPSTQEPAAPAVAF